MPLGPGTEHINRAFKNVVHLLTRLLCPPKSFYQIKISHQNFKSLLIVSALITIGRLDFCLWHDVYLTDLSYSGMRGFSRMLPIDCIFSEEKIYLVIFWIVTFRDQMSSNKPGICKGNAKHIASGVFTQALTVGFLNLWWWSFSQWLFSKTLEFSGIYCCGLSWPGLPGHWPSFRV